MWDLDVIKRVIMRGFKLGSGGPPGPPVPSGPPVSIQVETPDYTLPLLALGGLGIILLAGPKRKR